MSLIPLDEVIHCKIDGETLRKFKRHYPRKGDLSHAMREGIEARIHLAESRIAQQLATIGITNEPGQTRVPVRETEEVAQEHDIRRTAGVRTDQPSKEAKRRKGTRKGDSISSRTKFKGGST